MRLHSNSDFKFSLTLLFSFFLYSVFKQSQDEVFDTVRSFTILRVFLLSVVVSLLSAKTSYIIVTTTLFYFLRINNN